VGGIVGATVMAMFAMIASATYQGTGFFTPLYHIGSSLGGAAPMEAMKTSMEQAQSGDLLTWFTGPALTGALVHMVAGRNVSSRCCRASGQVLLLMVGLLIQACWGSWGAVGGRVNRSGWAV
jgi:hypothetical protein